MDKLLNYKKNTPPQQTTTPKKQEYLQKCWSQILNIQQLLLGIYLKKNEEEWYRTSWHIQICWTEW